MSSPGPGIPVWGRPGPCRAPARDGGGGIALDGQSGAPFWKGIATGIGLAAAAVALTVSVVTRRGVDVTVQTADVTARLRQEVQVALQRELPVALAQVKADLPRRVAAEAGRRLSETRIDLGGFAVPIPPVAVQQVEQAVGQALQAGLEAAIRRVDVDGLSLRLGDRAASLADQRLKEVLAGQRLLVEVAPGWKVPVRIHTR